MSGLPESDKESEKMQLPSREEVGKIAEWLDDIRAEQARILYEAGETDLDEIDITEELDEGALSEGERIVVGWFENRSDTSKATHMMTVDWYGSDDKFYELKPYMEILYKGTSRAEEVLGEVGDEVFTGEIRNFNSELWNLLKDIHARS